MDLKNQIMRLEKRVKTYRNITLFLFFLISIFLSGSGGGSGKGDYDSVTCRTLEIVDKNGNVVIRLYGQEVVGGHMVLSSPSGNLVTDYYPNTIDFFKKMNGRNWPVLSLRSNELRFTSQIDHQVDVAKYGRSEIKTGDNILTFGK